MNEKKIEGIFNAVQKVFSVTRECLTGPRRQRNVAEARLTAGYFLQTEAGLENTDVPKQLARSRAWASFALHRCPELSGMDRRYAAKVLDVYNQIKAA